MNNFSVITPNGQITIPRNIMKSLGIRGGNNMLIEVLNGVVVIRKCEENLEKKDDELIYTAV